MPNKKLGENAPLIIGGVLVGAALLLWMRSKSSQQTVSNQPALTIYPSTEADRSTIANITQAVNAFSQHNTPTSTPNPVPTPQGSGGNVQTGSGLTNEQWTQFLNSRFGNWGWNIPTGGNGSSGFGLPPSQTGAYSPTSQPTGTNAPTGVPNPGSWSAISALLANANPNALVSSVVDIQGRARQPNSAAPEQVATVSQYQALVLGQYPGATGVHAIGAPVDIQRGYDSGDKALTVDYLVGIKNSGAYNPNLPAIGSPQAVNSLLYSMTQDPKYLNG